jgi:hypothetical protein
MVRVIVSTTFVSMVALFGAWGANNAQAIFFCIAAAIIACGLGVWRAAVVYRKICERHERQRLFTEHMRRNMRANRY